MAADRTGIPNRRTARVRLLALGASGQADAAGFVSIEPGRAVAAASIQAIRTLG